MNTMTTVQIPPRPEPIGYRERKSNPWANDTVLMGLSVWWVQATRPTAHDFSGEVAAVFDSLQRDLQ